METILQLDWRVIATLFSTKFRLPKGNPLFWFMTVRVKPAYLCCSWDLSLGRSISPSLRMGIPWLFLSAIPSDSIKSFRHDLRLFKHTSQKSATHLG